jgi:hypothetical protein
MNGICTLANDRVYDQLVALLNSIEAIYGQQMPVCVYPYDDQLDRVTALIQTRPQVQLYDDGQSIHHWETFARRVWQTHPTARQQWGHADPDYCYRMGMHRRFCAFDGPFDRFIYMDADTLLLSPVDFIFEQLERHDWVVYDFQYKDPTHVYTVDSPQIATVFGADRVAAEIFCAGFYASKSGLFDQAQQDGLIDQLRQGDAAVLYPMAPDQTILNYMAMRSAHSIYNFALHLPNGQKTGNSVTSLHFEERDHLLYDRGNRLTYLHYIGLASDLFQQVCTGANIDFPYRDLFLHFRYRHEPEQAPKFTGRARAYNQPPAWSQRLVRKLAWFAS